MNPPPTGDALLDDIDRILLTEKQIGARLDELADELTRDLRRISTGSGSVEGVTFLALLNGSIVFLADLLRRIPLPIQVDCLSVASYHGTRSTGQITFRQTHLPDLRNRWVVLLDDIFDSGLTLSSVRDRVLAESGVAGVTTCVLLRKEIPRAIPLEPDHFGFSIGSEFVVGYGLDYFENYRNLPFIGVLKPSAIARHTASAPPPTPR